MNIEDVKTIDDLAVFMDEEAAREGREDYSQNIVHGNGIKTQWSQKTRFPALVFYLRRTNEKTFTMEGKWFDEDGNLTEHPDEEKKRLQIRHD